VLIIGISSTTLTGAERDWIRAPHVSGVILFARNFAAREQVARLNAEIRELRGDAFLICVDQEGGPVQRFRAGFTRLPALARIGDLYASDPRAAVARAEEHAWLMASEMRAIGVDMSFAPVVDLARGNRAIGERAFSSDPEVTSVLTEAYLRGLRLAGMAATIKHFPGHGSVAEDTHFDVAIDPRPLDELLATDLVPFADGIAAGAEAVMMAHVTYPAVDPLAAGYSRIWIETVLRGDFGFRGAVIGDDIGMAAAEGIGGIPERIAAHLHAGCDLLLACSAANADEAIAASAGAAPCDPELLTMLQGSVAQTWDALIANPQRDEFIARLCALDPDAATEHRP
jgi:beta-N-acetylhexosaminidase